MINNLRYADDTVIITESKNKLQQLMDAVSEVRHTCKITVYGNTLEQVDRFVYLGSLRSVRQRIAIAKSAFTSLEF